jgi:hypothetical protein
MSQENKAIIREAVALSRSPETRLRQFLGNFTFPDLRASCSFYLTWVDASWYKNDVLPSSRNMTGSAVSYSRGGPGCYFGRTAIRSISTKAPRAPAGRTTCTVVRAAYSVGPWCRRIGYIRPSFRQSPSCRLSQDRPPRYTCIITTSLSVSFCDSRNFWMSLIRPRFVTWYRCVSSGPGRAILWSGKNVKKER